MIQETVPFCKNRHYRYHQISPNVAAKEGDDYSAPAANGEADDMSTIFNPSNIQPTMQASAVLSEEKQAGRTSVG